MKKEYDRLIKEDGEKILKEVFKEYFVSFPEVEKIYWDQYTPYFNDGDPCTFRVNGFVLEYVDPDFDGDTVLNKENKKERKLRIKDINNALDTIEKSIPEDVLEAVFGNHVTISVTKDGFTIEECDHE